MEIKDEMIKWAFSDPCPWESEPVSEHSAEEMAGCLYMLLFTKEGFYLYLEKKLQGKT